MDLPDLKAKVKIDDSGILATELKLKALGHNVKQSLDQTDVEGFGRRTSASLDEVEKKLAPTGQAFVRFGKEGEVAGIRISSATAKTHADIENLERRVRSFAGGMERDMRKGATAMISLSDDGAASLGKVTQQLQDTQRVAASSTSILASLGAAFSSVAAVAIPALIVAAIALVAALTPVLLAVAGATVIVSAFAVAWSGLALTWAFVLGPLAAVAAGIVLLAEKTGHLAGPLQTLGDHAKKMADALGKEAAPMAAKLLEFIDSLLPKVHEMGSAIINWFGNRMPAALSVFDQTIKFLFFALERLGGVLDRFSGGGGQPWNRVWPIMAASILVAIDAIEALLNNFLRLSDWLVGKLPTMGGVTAGIMAYLGEVIQWLARVAAKWVDWFIANWPKITKAASDEWEVIGPILDKLGEAIGKAFGWIIDHWPEIKASVTSVFLAIKEGWDLVQPVFKTLRETFEALQPTIKFLEDHANELRPILIGLGIAAGMAVVGFAALGLMIGAVIIGLEIVFMALGKVIRFLVDNWDPATKQSGENMSRFGTIVHGVVEEIGGAFSWLGGTVNGALGGIGDAMSGLGGTVRQIVGEIDDNFSAMGGNVGGVLASIGDRMSQLGSTANAVVGDIGGAFSALGGTVSGVLGWIGGEMSQLGSTANWVVGDIGGAFSWLGGAVSGSLSWIGDRMSDLGSTARWLADVVWGAANDFAGAFGRAEDAVWSLIYALGNVAGAVYSALANIPGVGGAISYLQGLGRASGGPVLPGSIYTVGEAGPETLVMGASGGYVIPNAGSSDRGGGGGPYTININISGAGNPEAVAAAVDWRLSRLLTTI